MPASSGARLPVRTVAAPLTFAPASKIGRTDAIPSIPDAEAKFLENGRHDTQSRGTHIPTDSVDPGEVSSGNTTAVAIYEGKGDLPATAWALVDSLAEED